jgi:hypothetical protein
MAHRRRKSFAPIVLGWSKTEQRRFREAVERFHGLVNDLERVLAPAKRRKAMHIDPNAGKSAAESNGTGKSV